MGMRGRRAGQGRNLKKDGWAGGMGVRRKEDRVEGREEGGRGIGMGRRRMGKRGGRKEDGVRR